MKKLVTKMLFGVIALSVMGQNFVQAAATKKENSIWQSVTTCAQGIGTVGAEIASRAFKRSSWLAKSALSGGNKLVSIGVQGVQNCPHRDVIAKCAVGVAIVGGACLLANRYLPNCKINQIFNYDGLACAISNQCKIGDLNEEIVRGIFEGSTANNYMPQWDLLKIRRIKYIDGFINHLKSSDKVHRGVLQAAAMYRNYLKRPRITVGSFRPINLKQLVLGAAIGIGFTFKLQEKPAPEPTIIDDCYLG